MINVFQITGVGPLFLFFQFTDAFSILRSALSNLCSAFSNLCSAFSVFRSMFYPFSSVLIRSQPFSSVFMLSIPFFVPCSQKFSFREVLNISYIQIKRLSSLWLSTKIMANYGNIILKKLKKKLKFFFLFQ